MKKLRLLFLSVLVTGLSANAQKIDRSKFITDSLDGYINRALTNWRIPGAAVCIVKDGKIVMMKGYGIKELGLPNKVDANTLFMIGSNTKAFTATALAMLQADKKISLDDRVTKYIPEFKLENHAAGEQAIIKDLLCHRLGFRTFQGDFTFYNSNLSRHEIIEKLGKIKATYPFRTTWGYTNAAFLTAGEIINRAVGKQWETYLKESIFTPLGMSNTLALTADMPKATNRTVPHTLVDGRLTALPYATLDGLAPAGAISSSANDMGKWVMALLDNGKVGNKQVIPAAAIAATRQAQDYVSNVNHLNGDSGFELYGLGWFLQDYCGKRLVMHDGGVTGYVSSVTIVPSEKLGIVILTNTDANALYEALRWDILDAYLGNKNYHYNDVYLAYNKTNTATMQAIDKQKRDTVMMNLKPQLSIGKYTGKYYNDLYGNMTIERGEEGNQLEARFEHHPKMYAKMMPLGGNRFEVEFSDPTFGKSVFPFFVKDGKVTGIRVKVADFVEKDPYDFRKLD
ncbi:serine hydrolase [Mucilaginibacter achroorhodeus]|uniref:Serine hydrolase n=1 Tax=Mucilaginibacter achroorhodeus TaxID=2599294 RepID=A0A563UB45_9SPHI|nr:serine hydrolase [Mucilaginibacter achroorhodeus]TWR28588.1 serine hydrolase [Mucilaginibacter achroorhodeus]